MTDAPAGLYIHVPFCVRKCDYCDFYSTDNRSLIPAYVDALGREIQIRCRSQRRPQRLDRQDKIPAGTLYFGGGTPSLLSLDAVAEILARIRSRCRLLPGAEVTFEVNPGTVDRAYLAGLRNLGINRLSIGAQSFEPDKIAFLTRIHSREDTLAAVADAGRAGFRNIGLDLMYALPFETPDQWQRDLETAVHLEPVHLSCYMLTVEPDTPLRDRLDRGTFQPVPGGRRTQLFLETAAFLEKNGYLHYEVSNFARGRENRSRHNSAYWRMVPYFGFGPSAHSYTRSGPETGSGNYGVRSWNRSDVRGYIDSLKAGRLPVAETEILTRAQHILELAMLGLRTLDGIDTGRIDREMPGRGFDELYERLAAEGLGRFSDAGASRRFRLTRPGLARLDSILEAFAERIL